MRTSHEEQECVWNLSSRGFWIFLDGAYALHNKIEQDEEQISHERVEERVYPFARGTNVCSRRFQRRAARSLKERG